MKAIYLSAHGNSGQDDTFIPIGKTVTFYCKDGDGISQTLTAAVVSLEQGFQSYTLQGGATVNNYTIGPLNSSEAANEVRFLSSKLQGDFSQSPDSTLLCDSFDCTIETGHTCTGVLGKATAEYDTVHLLICRGEGELEYYDLAGMDELCATFLGIKDEADRRAAWMGYTDRQRSQLILLGNISAWYETLCASLWASEREGSPFGLARYMAAAEGYVHDNLAKYADPSSTLGAEILAPVQNHVEYFLESVKRQRKVHAELIAKIAYFQSGDEGTANDPTKEWEGLSASAREDFLVLAQTRKMSSDAFNRVFKFAGKESFQEWRATLPVAEWWLDSDVALVKDRAFRITRIPNESPQWPACLNEEWCWIRSGKELELVKLNTESTARWLHEQQQA
ncbi:putative adhesin [Streptomyces sp. NBC_01264]|uniref:putative adhesin n=1 Tax=Streptomyces sp. NBC_01264 TaxID=2903804 RepID=UPI00224EBE58|nr:hypothetical protein [Streptomyces sp. NBC_01264]MCX4784179.1 hypothetical protein [Streptomyces sp. NBC_01264]